MNAHSVSVALLDIDDNWLSALQSAYSELRKRAEQLANALATLFALCECVAV